ncbi:MAG: TRAP-type mannitol/chloroaromatic compound transport system substrate-binding protein [Planctomycetota bacterium]|jgi:TRAP-type mannitol/chloroaromatic compound transport system substrate-binding protein
MTENKTVGRRGFLTAGAITAAGAAAACCPKERAVGPNVHTSQRVKWRLASSFPSSLDTMYGAALVLSKRVAEMSGGAFEIAVYESGEIVSGLNVMDPVQSGAVEVGQTASYYYKGKNPALSFDTCVPFGMNARQQSAWLLEDGGLELIHELFSDFGIITFPCGNTGTQMGGWFREQIHSKADLAGLKMRIPGMGGDVMNALGVTVQNIAGGEIYQALERGVIDATEWVGPYDDEKLGFHQVAKNYYYPGWWEPGPSLSFLVNRDAWDALPVTYQHIFRAASQESAAAMVGRYDVKNPPALERLLASGVTLRKFPDDVMTAAQDASRQLMSDHAAGDAGYRKIYEIWESKRKAAFQWFGTAELAYAEFAFR